MGASDRGSRGRRKGLRSGGETLAAGALGGIARRAARLADLQDRVRAALPADLAAHCQVVGFDDGHLRVLVSSSLRATQLRYQQRALSEALGQDGAVPFRSLDVKVTPPTAGEVDSGHSRRPLGISARAADQLREAASTESDPDLRQALLNLAGRRR